MRATVAPTTVALGAAGAGIGALDHSVVVAVVLGALGYGGRAAWLAWRRLHPRRTAPPAPVDPWSVPLPWRPLLADALDAQRRFSEVAGQMPDGPTRERVAPMVARIEASVRAAEVAAKRSASLVSPARTARAESLSVELTTMQRQPLGPSPEARAEHDAHEAALAAQLSALRRAETVSAAGLDQLRLLAARLDDAVTELVELSATQPVDPATSHGPGSLTGVLDELDALHDGLEQTGRELQAAEAPPGSLGP